MLHSFRKALTHHCLVVHQGNLVVHAEESDDHEDVSYDVESLFTSIPVKETINYIIQKNYIKKEIKPFCKKSIFKELLKKLTQQCLF